MIMMLDYYISSISVHRSLIKMKMIMVMRSVFSKGILSILLAFYGYGCTGDPTVGPISHSDQLVPLSVGNQWTYADSIFTSSGCSATSFTVTVKSRIDTLGRKWWQIENAFNPSIASNMFSASSDSIFSLQKTESVSGMALVVSLEYVKPINHDSTRYRALFDGDAFLTKSALGLNQPYSIAVGKFDNCILYTYDIYPEHYREIVSPGIGIIALEIQADSIRHVSPAWQRRIELIDYRIQK